MEKQSGTMENLELNSLFGGIYHNKKVLLTGHTGFKGSWLALWLKLMGANVSGISLDPPSHPYHYNLIKPEVKNYRQDITDFEGLKKVLHEIKPEIIFHLAAQSLVRKSYKEPLNTFHTNINGTMNILEASRTLPGLKAVIIITTDKCYENKEWVWGYRENEQLGGKDPYSASKACAELVTAAYRHSFFSDQNNVLIASARAGNVIGGGDWASDRIMTDIVMAASQSKKVLLRYPNATRPWQNVLEPLSGYLTLGWQLMEGKAALAEAWNFGPAPENNITVLDLVKYSVFTWDKIQFEIDQDKHPHEAGFLMLDSTKAMKMLKWKPIWGIEKTICQTIRWYKDYYEYNQISSLEILNEYIADARKLNLVWTH